MTRRTAHVPVTALAVLVVSLVADCTASPSDTEAAPAPARETTAEFAGPRGELVTDVGPVLPAVHADAHSGSDTAQPLRMAGVEFRDADALLDEIRAAYKLVDRVRADAADLVRRGTSYVIS